MAPVDQARPAQAAFRRHVMERCRFGGNSWRCRQCRRLYADASAEDWKRHEAAIGQRQPYPDIPTHDSALGS